MRPSGISGSSDRIPWSRETSGSKWTSDERSTTKNTAKIRKVKLLLQSRGKARKSFPASSFDDWLYTQSRVSRIPDFRRLPRVLDGHDCVRWGMRIATISRESALTHSINSRTYRRESISGVIAGRTSLWPWHGLLGISADLSLFLYLYNNLDEQSICTCFFILWY